MSSVRVRRLPEPRAISLERSRRILLWPKAFRRTQWNIHAEQAPPHHERIAHVAAAVPDEGIGDLLDWLLGVLHHRQRLRQRLGRMELVGQPVPHRHAGEPAQGLNHLLREPPVLDPAVRAAEDWSGPSSPCRCAGLVRLRRSPTTGRGGGPSAPRLPGRRSRPGSRQGG